MVKKVVDETVYETLGHHGKSVSRRELLSKMGLTGAAAVVSGGMLS